ncbi:unnamed protein product, partial [Ectocarpus sp. 12 AP-2014]
ARRPARQLGRGRSRASRSRRRSLEGRCPLEERSAGPAGCPARHLATGNRHPAACRLCRRLPHRLRLPRASRRGLPQSRAAASTLFASRHCPGRRRACCRGIGWRNRPIACGSRYHPASSPSAPSSLDCPRREPLR